MIDFCGKRKLFYTISIVVIACAILSTLIFGIQLDIQFKGGAIITYSHTGEVDKGAAEQFIQSTLGENVSVQEAVDITTGNTNMVVSLTADKSLSSDKQLALTDALQKEFPDQNFEVIQINNVDPTIGKEFFAKCLVALVLSAFLMVVYIAFRFRKIGGWSAGVMCVLALIHDSIVVFATFIICRIPLNENFIAVVITIIGYSLNATIVIYDRIRENRQLIGKTMPLAELVTKSVNQSLGRTIMTSVSTIAAMTIVCIVGKVVGLDSILSFAFPLTMGMISGLYSSVCIAPALWTSWQEYKVKKAA
ncbi:protein translocase subunit SecF [Hydrogenoanaerobacterium sp.]|uniref:protein translocase subunit SecF n=1 Tax=Hydrogenoanaerobacterium sp. TaxID=2953763 RepID=UPI0028A21C43|nr:protein translocase subunit SecF [Hydrogenoanaerobacterium sp.]